MDFVANREPQQKKMLQAIGVDSVDALFDVIPASIKLKRPAADDGLSEYDGLRLMESIAKENTFSIFDSYLGLGAYEHHIPAIVPAICGKSEFLTAYTPYQPEASQGMLQAIFEFQSAICALTGMDASNASVYDGASACAEALLMALRHRKPRGKIFIAASLNPLYRSVVDQYLAAHSTPIVDVPFASDGKLDLTFLQKHLDGEVAALLVQNPNVFGILDNVQEAFKGAKENGTVTILCANPLVYGLCPTAAELGADIAVGDCQPFGIPLQFGGPYAGYIACRQELVRQLPGRIAGETVDGQGRRGFVLTLQAREQHIRREKATSNICTNQALAALACLVSLLWYGKQGVRALALTNFQRAAYLKKCLESVDGVTLVHPGPHFNEFVVTFDRPASEVLASFHKRNIEPGVQLGRYFPTMAQALLVAVTETKSKKQLDLYVEAAKEAARRG